ncbi:hypothetical protein GcM1_180016 [Golovinomyces cichoracearum]|uniref:DDE Tnp4 domain-containing protein n=1 Tax=Golovinomyces cichoracearum TaxID=62708 RepID=A0A420J4G6_9PEZI|nr:hypothetical protein GcM1_180016 [Golovinomyces cichoracearum]
MKEQVRVLLALCCLHNILLDIKEESGEASTELEDHDEEEVNSDDLSEEQRSGEGYQITRAHTLQASIKRNQIAGAMWEAHL